MLPRVPTTTLPLLLLAVLGGCGPEESAQWCDDETGMVGDGDGDGDGDGVADAGEPWVRPSTAYRVQLHDLPGTKSTLPTEVPTAAPRLREWHYDGEFDVAVRYATRRERRRHGWRRDTILIAQPDLDRAVALGGGTLPAIVPLRLPGHKAVRLVRQDLRLRSYHDHVRVVERRVDPTGNIVATSDRPVFGLYGQVGVEPGGYTIQDGDFFASGYSDQRGVAIEGAIATASYMLSGPIRADTLTNAPPIAGDVYVVTLARYAPGMFHVMDPPESDGITPDPLLADVQLDGECWDGKDNDGDGYPDACDFECIAHTDYGGKDFADAEHLYEDTKSFGIFPDGKYCTSHEGWASSMVVRGDFASDLLNNVDAMGLDEAVPVFRLAVLGCVTFPTLDDAEACHDDGDCPSGFEDYPYAGVGETMGASNGSETDGYIGHVWEMVDLAAGDSIHRAGQPAVPIHLAIAAGTSYDEAFGGRARGALDQDFVWLNGACTAGTGEPSVLYAHELGHTVGLPHHNVYDDDGVLGFMATEGGSSPVLGNTDSASDSGPFGPTDLTPLQIWLQYTQEKFWPRASGFAFTGCPVDGDLCGPYPGFTCTHVEAGKNFCKSDVLP